MPSKIDLARNQLETMLKHCHYSHWRQHSQHQEHYDKCKNNLHRGINETYRQIKGKYEWAGSTRNVEKFIRAWEISQKKQ